MDNPSLEEAAFRFMASAGRFATDPEVRRYVRNYLRRKPTLRSKDEGLELLRRAIVDSPAWPWAHFFETLSFLRLRRWCWAVLGTRVRSRKQVIDDLAAFYAAMARQPYQRRHAPPPPPPPREKKQRRQRQAPPPRTPPPPRPPLTEVEKLQDKMRKIDALIADAACTPGEREAARQARSVLERKLQELRKPPGETILAPCFACRVVNRIRVDRMHERPKCGRCHAELFRPTAAVQ